MRVIKNKSNLMIAIIIKLIIKYSKIYTNTSKSKLKKYD